MSQFYVCSRFCKVLGIRSKQVAHTVDICLFGSFSSTKWRKFSTHHQGNLLSFAQHCHWGWPNTPAARVPYLSFHSGLSTAAVHQTHNPQDWLSTDGQATPGNSNHQKGETVVYVGTLARMVRFVKFFSLSSSLVGLSVLPYIYKNIAQLPVALAAVISSFMGFFIMVTPLVLHLVTKRYVTSITLDHVSGRFTAVTYSFFLIEKRLEFTANQAKVPAVPRLFTTLVVNDNVPLFVDPSLFVDRQAFLQLMKYDEPLEWEIEEEENLKEAIKEKPKIDT